MAASLFRSLWVSAWEGVMEVLWPTRTECLICTGQLEGDGEPVCTKCWAEMGFPSGAVTCTRCLRPMERPADLCRECQDGNAFGRVWALGFHKGSLREAIHHLKFNGREELAGPLGARLAGLISTRYDLIIPVPLHPSRLRERGYNQAALLARAIAADGRALFSESVLVRLRRTGHQAKLERKDRLQNLKGAFARSAGSAPLTDQTILLVDDVLTTGATATAAADVLLLAGARRVDLAVLAVSTTLVGPGGRER